MNSFPSSVLPGLLRIGAILLALTLSGLLTPLPAAAQAIVRVDDSVDDRLAAHWKFDEPAAATGREVVAGANGTLGAGAAMTFGPLPPVIFSDPAVLSLDGAGGRVDVADHAALNVATSFSVAAWVRRSTINTYDAIYDSGDQANQWWVFIADGSAAKLNRLGFGERGVAEVYSTQAITDTAWHHVAVVKDGDSGTNLAFYVDGIRRGTASVGSVTPPSGPKTIGALIDGSLLAQFGGNLDDVRIYSRALAGDEVLRLAQGKGCVTKGGAWQTAMRDLQCALAEAASGDQVWIGEGVYKTGLYRFAPFRLKNGVDLYGGFRGLSAGGDESALDQRPAFDPLAPLTTLSGDILGNDLPAGFGNYGDNNSVVLFAPGGVVARVDGLRVQGGNADGAAGGLSNNGGGMRAAPGSTVALNNVVFFANRANLDGGAVYSQAPLQVTAGSFISNTSAAGNGGALATTAALALTSSIFLSNTAAGDGGAVLADAPATVMGGLFRGNRATAFYGGAIAARQPLTVSQAIFVANVAGFEGGAIASAAAAMLDGATFQENRALTFYGGAVAAAGPLTIQGSTFLSNTASFGGGAVASQSPAGLTVGTTQASFNRVLGGNCTPACSHGFGGAIYAVGPLTLTAGVLTDNYARLNGGALAVAGSTTLISNTFAANRAAIPVDANNPGRGGAVFSSGALTDSGSRFERNEAPAGGAVYIDGGASDFGSGVFTGTLFLTNTAASQGGGLLATQPITLTDTRFVSNTVTNGSGGGLHAESGAVLTANHFERNHAAGAGGDGGALLVAPGPLIAAGNVYTGNVAGRFGGAAFAAGATSDGDRFTHNQAGGEGGALLAAAGMTITHALFDGNGATLSGALVADGPADRSQLLHVSNSLFIRNQRTAGSGAADLRTFDITGQFANNTFADPAPGSTPAIQLFRSTITVANNIFANYGASVTENSVGGASAVQVEYNLLFNAPLGSSISPGPGNLSADPLFADAAAGNYRVQFASPAIDAGMDSALAASATRDLAGLPRLVDILAIPDAVVDGAAQIIDIGAYEFQNQAPAANAGGPYAGVEGAPVALDGSASASGAGIATYAWDCTGDGAFESISGTPTGFTCTYPDNGEYTVRLQVVDVDGLAAGAKTAVTIANLPPLLAPAAGQAAVVGQEQSIALGSFTDPGPDAPWQVTVDWGDAQPASRFTVDVAGALPAQAHVYLDAGLFAVMVTVADKDNGSQAQTFQVSVLPEGQGDNRLFLPTITR